MWGFTIHCCNLLHYNPEKFINSKLQNHNKMQYTFEYDQDTNKILIAIMFKYNFKNKNDALKKLCKMAVEYDISLHDMIKNMEG